VHNVIMFMGKSYRPYHPDQQFLLPPSLRECLPENHVVYFVSDVVDHLNLSALDTVYADEQRRQPAYDSSAMSRQIAVKQLAANEIELARD